MHFWILLFALWTASNSKPAVDRVSFTCSRQSDSLALVSFYQSTNGQDWVVPWNLNQTMNNWYGVELDGSGCVIALRLASLNITGTIPNELGLLENLRVLYLVDNKINGTLPSSIGLLRQLEEINLEGNNLSGNIPASLGNLSVLRALNLSKNQFSGPFPVSLTSLTFLQELNLSDNRINGPIPSQISAMTGLRLLNLNNNLLQGELPSAIAVLRNLRELYLGGNQLSGSLPPAMVLLNSLQSVWLNDNNFSGEVPDLTTAPLVSLRLENNHFNSIPDYSLVRSWGTIPPLGLIIHHNDFTFEDLIPLQKMPRNSHFDFKPQNPIYLDSLIYVSSGNNYAIRLNIDPSIPDNNYKWLKDSSELLISNQNFFQIINASESDEGYYSGSVRNNAVDDFELQISRARVIVFTPGRCNDPVPSSTCFQAPVLCSTQEFHDYCGFLLGRNPGDETGYYCDSALTTQNQSFVQFVASDDTIVFEIFPRSCSVVSDSLNSYDGIQAAVFEACDTNSAPLYCQSECKNIPFFMGGGGFKIGATYTMLIDGCLGNNCEYLIKVVKGRSNIDLVPGATIKGDRSFCPDDGDHFFAVDPVSGADIYLWYINDTLFSATRDTFVNIRDFNSGVYKLAIKAANNCDTTNEIATTFRVLPEMFADSIFINTIGNDSAFSISMKVKGGTPPFRIKSGKGTLDSLSGEFHSAFQNCNSAYFLEFEDRLGCLLVYTGFETCGCGSIAASMPPDTLRVCEGQNFEARGLGNEKLDPGDVLLYIIYTNPSDPVGSSLRTSNNGIFPFDPARFRFNTPFYVSQLTTKLNSRGQPNLLHPCISISNPQVVYFYPRPILSGGGNPTFCGKEGVLNASGNVNSVSWRKISGPGNLQFSNPDSIWTRVMADSLGTFIVELKGRTQFCERNIQLTVRFQDQLKPEIDGFWFYCPGQTTRLDAGPGFTSYNWSSGQTGRIIEVDRPGTYCVTVTDANFCSGSSCADVVLSDAPVLSLEGPDSLCTGINIEIGPRESFANYVWSGGQMTKNISIDTGGTYCLIVQADNGCRDTACLDIVPLPRSYKSLSDSACLGTDYVFGGKAYRVPGVYDIVFPGANRWSCDSIVRLTLNQYPVMFVSDTTITPDNGSSNGSIQVVIKGGKQPYRYIWSNGATTPNINNLPGGNYTLTVRDAANCVRMFSFTVKMNVSVADPTAEGSFVVYPNPGRAGSALFWTSSQDAAYVKLSLLDLRGQSIFDKNFGPVVGGEHYECEFSLAPGIYLLRFEDNLGFSQILRYVVF